MEKGVIDSRLVANDFFFSKCFTKPSVTEYPKVLQQVRYSSFVNFYQDNLREDVSKSSSVIPFFEGINRLY